MDREHSYVIIAGATRSGTTALYEYLSAHPQVCASSLKETRFFIDPDYPIHVQARLEDGFEQYEMFFSHCERRIRLESSPQYLFSPGSASRIRRTLADVKLIFLLRDPIDWLISSYRFGKQIGRIDAGTSFAGFINDQFKLLEKGVVPREHHLRALINGRFLQHLKRFEDEFNLDSILVLPFEGLASKPEIVMSTVCKFVGIDSGFYSDFEFQVHNPSRKIRSKGIHRFYISARRSVSTVLKSNRRLWTVLRCIFIKLKPFYDRFNLDEAADIRIDRDLQGRLDHYFKPEIAFVTQLYDRIKDE